MNYQVIFMDNEGTVQAGIWNKDRDEIICGCCGATIESGDFVLLHIYHAWVNISNEICGDDEETFQEIEEKINAMTTDQIQTILDKKEDLSDGFLN